MSHRAHIAALSLTIITYLGVATWKARTMYVWSNEAWFASPALTLLQKGYLGTTIFETTGTWMEGMERRTYWLPPAHLLVQTAWYRLFGFSLGSLRSISVLSGALVLLAWYAILRLVFDDRNLALLSIALAAAEPRFLTFAALGRADMMCAALGASAWAAYLYFRNRSHRTAVVTGHVLAAASCLTHPCGVLYAGGLVVLMLYYDRGRIGFGVLLGTALPYAAVAAWGVYILQAPSHFLAQFTGNISGIAGEFAGVSRWSGLGSPFTALRREYLLRYTATSGLYHRELVERVMLFPHLIYTLAVIGCLLIGRIRKRVGFAVLFWLGLFLYVMMALFDGLKGSAYLVHTLPLCAALLAIFGLHLFDRAKGVPRWALAAVMLAFLGVQLGATARYLLDQPVRRDYEEVVALLRRHPRPAPIIAAGEFAFALGFESAMVDDFRLGYFSGRRPPFIVANSIYRGWFTQSATTHPEIRAFTTRLLRDEYRVALRNANYTVYERIGD